MEGAKEIGSYLATIDGSNTVIGREGDDASLVAYWRKNYELDVSARYEFSIRKIRVMIRNTIKRVEYNGAEQGPTLEAVGLLSEYDVVTVTYGLSYGGSEIGVKAMNAGAYLIEVKKVEYTYTGTDGGTHRNWYDIGLGEEYLENSDLPNEWVFTIAPKEVEVTVNSVYGGTSGYVFNNAAHTTTLNVPGVSPREYTYFLAYSLGSVDRGTWVFIDRDNVWKVTDLGTNRTLRAAERSEIPIDAGVWNVVVKDVSGGINYHFVYDRSEIGGVMTIDKRHTRLVLGNDIGIEYDGEEHRIDVTTEPEMYEGDGIVAVLEYKSKTSTEDVWTTEISAIGEYYVRIKDGTATAVVTNGSEENYEFEYPGAEEYGTLSISARRVEFSFGDVVETYNGEGHVPTATAERILSADAIYIKVVVDGYIFGKTREVTEANGDNVNVNNGYCYAKVGTAHFEKADESVDDGKFAEVSAKYRITQEGRGRVTVVPATLRVTIDPLTEEYDAEAHTTTATVRGLFGTDTAEVTLAYTDNVNVGTCVVTATGARFSSASDKNYVFEDLSTVRGELTIEPFAVTVEAADTTATYDGDVRGKSIGLLLKNSLGEVVSLYGDDGEYLVKDVRYTKGKVTTRTPIDAGVWSATIEGVGLSDAERARNYAFGYRGAAGTLTIEKGDYDFSALSAYLETVGYTFSAVYNGKEQTPDFGAHVPQGADGNTYVLRGVFDGTVKEVSEGQVTLHVTFRTFVKTSSTTETQADSPNYNVPTQEYTVTFSLTKKSLAVVWGPQKKNASGEYVVAVQYSGENSKPVATAEGEDGTIALRVSVTSASYGRVSDTPYEAVARLEEGSADAENYSLTGDTTEFYVVKKVVSVQFFGYTGLVYNGREQSVQVKVQDGGLVGEDRLPLLVGYDKALVRDAGTYVATASIDEGNAGSAIENYELDATGVTCSFTIARCKATVKANDLSSVYGAPLVPFRGTGKYTAEGFFESDLRILTVTLTKEEGLDVGTYRITPSAEMYNYDVTFFDGVYTIYPKEITVVLHDQVQTDPLSSDLSKVQGVAWDVKEGDAIVGNDRLNISLTTSVDLSDPTVRYGVIRATYSNGNYHVTFVGDKQSDGSYAEYARFIVTKTQAVLSVKEDFLQSYPKNSKVYDGKSVRVRVENSGGGTVSFFINGVASDNNLTEPGEYRITVKGTAKEEYYPPEDLQYTFTIYPNEITTEFGASYTATLKDDKGYSTTASFSLVEDETAEKDAAATFASTENASTKQLTDYYVIQTDGEVSGTIRLDVSSNYNNGDKVTLYIYKHNGECELETYEVKEGSIVLKNVEEIEGIGFVSDNNGPGILTIVLFVLGGILVLGILFIPIVKRRR